MLRSVLAAWLCALALAGCTPPNPPNATAETVRRSAFVSGAEPSITLLTVRDVRSDGGAHTALLIDGTQRVLWDPAGSFVHPDVPEVGDVLFGVSPLVDKVYTDYHVRPEYYMIRQRKRVDARTADRLIALARSGGRASHATCAITTSRLLREAGIDVRRTFFPRALMTSFGELPGVTTRRIDMTNVDTGHNVIFGKDGVSAPRT